MKNLKTASEELHSLIDGVNTIEKEGCDQSAWLLIRIKEIATPDVIDLPNNFGVSPLARIVGLMQSHTENQLKLLYLKSVFGVLMNGNANPLLPVCQTHPQTILEKCLELRDDPKNVGILYTLGFIARAVIIENPLLTTQDGHDVSWVICRRMLGRMQAKLSIENDEMVELSKYLRSVNAENHDPEAVAKTRLQTLTMLWKVASNTEADRLAFDHEGENPDTFWNMHNLLAESIAHYLPGGHDEIEKAILPLAIQAHATGLPFSGQAPSEYRRRLAAKVEMAGLELETPSASRPSRLLGSRL